MRRRAHEWRSTVINVVVAGLGGQGVLKASDILADAAFRAGLDVKKGEVHGMSQRGGSVTSDVRFGARRAESRWSRRARPISWWCWRPPGGGRRGRCSAGRRRSSRPTLVDESALPNRKSLNVALLGRAVAPPRARRRRSGSTAVRAALPEQLHAVNVKAFQMGRDAAALANVVRAGGQA